MCNSLPSDKIFDWLKLKAFADDKLNMNKKLNFVLESVENIVGKGVNAGYQHFLLFPQCFQKFSFSASLISQRCQDCVGKSSMTKTTASVTIHAFLHFLLAAIWAIFFPNPFRYHQILFNNK